MSQKKSKRWVIADRVPESVDRELQAFQPTFRQLLFNRGITTEEAAQQFLYGKGEVHDPFLLKGMDQAVPLILDAISQGKKIVVYGDYDADGVTATALLVEGIQALGGRATGYIPNRFDEGYGLNSAAIRQLAQEGADLVVSVDCGIRSVEEAAVARELGLPLIITDHHHPLTVVPDAAAVICPKQEGDAYPEKNLSGVGLAYKLFCGLCMRSPACAVDVEEWLDLVAIGTVADMVPLVGENRILVRRGLNKLRIGKRIGVVALANVAGTDLITMTASTIGFQLGPRINAAGRIESPMAAYDLLTSKGILESGLLAQRVDDRNRERQQQTRDMQLQAESMLNVDDETYILTVVDEAFNSGIIGLVASRLTEENYLPTIVGSRADGEIRASCRSIVELHITKTLDECADLLVRHGGHASAAGFTVLEDRWPELLERLNAIARRELAHKDLRPVIRIDADVALKDLKSELLDWIELLEPTGMENPLPVFCTRNVELRNVKVIGSEKNHLKFLAAQQNLVFDCVAFKMAELKSDLPKLVDIAYTFEKNNWQGRTSLQLKVIDIKPAASLQSGI